MLDRIRRSSNNLFIKFILGLITISFVGIGGASFIGNNNQQNIVKFDHIAAISLEEFEASKAREIELIQKQNNITLTLEQIENLALDRMVLDRLVNERMLEYLAKQYNITLSEEKIIDFIKQAPYFKDEQGKFNPALFNAAFGNSTGREQEYINLIKKELISAVIYNIFINSFQPANLMKNNMVNYLAENRIADIISVPIDAKPQSYQTPKITLSEIDKFYQENKSLFMEEEKRDFTYLNFGPAYWQKNITISEEELKNYFTENSEQFAPKDFVDSRLELLTELTNQKIEESLSELSKNLEDELASGTSLSELAQKYKLDLIKEKNISLAKMQNDSKELSQALGENIFELIEGEISYPIELPEINNLVIAEINKITPAKQLELSEVMSDIEKILTTNSLKDYNLQKLKEFRNNYKSGEYDQNFAKNQQITISKKGNFARMELTTAEKNTLPNDLLFHLFEIEKDTITPIFTDGEKLYFAYLVNINLDRKQVQKFNEKQQEHLSNLIQRAVADELITYLTRKNNIKFLQSSY